MKFNTLLEELCVFILGLGSCSGFVQVENGTHLRNSVSLYLKNDCAVPYYLF